MPRIVRSVLLLTMMGWAPNASAQTASIGNYTLVSEQRVTRTVYEYTYRARLTNTGAVPFESATATVKSSDPTRTTIVEGSLTFGAVAAGGSAQSTDTFVFRHDRTVALNLSVLVWSVTPVTRAPALTALAPVSGPQGQTFSVALTGRDTHWAQGTSTASFGPGITVSALTVASATSATANISIGPTAAPGARAVSVTTGSETVSLAAAFTVTQPPPTITATVTPAANAAGWHRGPVTVTFACTNTAECPAAVTVSTEGSAQEVSRTASNASGLTATATVTLNIDLTLPALTIATPVTDGEIVQLASYQASGTARDLLSGLSTMRCNGVAALVQSPPAFTCQLILQAGDNTLTFTATDVAGNVSTATRTLRFESVAGTAPQVAINSPSPSTLFASAAITVTGTIDNPQATVNVNGVIATVNGTTFTANDVVLREGLNLVVATARSPEGGVSSASISVLLDTTPPVVRIQAPDDGSVVTNAQIAVAGMINDIVSGTVNAEQATVTVNGVTADVSNRSFVAHDVLLVRGRNVIRAAARDRAGNVAQTEIAVTLQDQAGQQRIVALSGGGQSAVVRQPIHEPLVAQLLDAAGRPAVDRPVTFTVRRSDGVLQAFPNEGQELTVRTDDAGRAQVSLTLGSRVGAGVNEVVATAAGFVGEAIFSATSTVAPATQIKGAGVMGESFRGLAGKRLAHPLEAIVFDAGGNPVADVPVTFTVAQGGGSMDGQTTLVRATDTDGRVSGYLTLGEQEGINNNVVTAQFEGLAGLPLTFTATGVVAGAAEQTRVSGVVLDNADKPIPGATATIVGTGLTAVTNQDGQFAIPNAPVGNLTLIVDGATSPRPERFPFLAFMINALAGQDNTVGMPIYLPPLDTENSQLVGGDQPVVLTMKGVPGVEFTVFPNSATFPDGSRVGRLSLSQVHADKVPMPPPYGTAPRVVWTLQPAGVKFSPAIKVQLPNTDGLAPGTVIEIYQFDHDIEQFVSAGPARVSRDGSVIVSDPGFGTTKSGWGGGPPPPPPQTCVDGCSGTAFSGGGCVTGQCVNGQCVYTPTPAGTSCDDGSGCSNKACNGNGQCVEVSRLPDDTACTPPGGGVGTFCGPFTCQSGACRQNTIPDEVLTPAIRYEPVRSVIAESIKEWATKLKLTKKLNFRGLVVGLRKSSCCEATQSFVINRSVTVGLDADVEGELSWPIPQAPLIYVYGKLKLAGTGQGTLAEDLCANQPTTTFAGSVGLSFDGGLKAKIPFIGDVGRVAIATGGSGVCYGKSNGVAECDITHQGLAVKGEIEFFNGKKLVISHFIYQPGRVLHQAPLDIGS